MAELAPLIVFSDEWGRHPSSCQHLISQLLPHRRVVWVNTIGMRPPRWNWATATRGLEKLQSWFWPRPLETVSGEAVRPEVLNPKMWPSFGSRFSRSLNRRLLLRALRPIVEAMPVPPIAIATLPLVADLVGVLPASRWVYYCVDDYGVWPGLDGRTLRNMEAELVPKVETIIAVSETLQEHLGKPSHLLTHGVDLAHFRSPVSAWETGLLQPQEARFPKQKPGFVLFWGVVDRRLDLDYVRHLSARLIEGTILFVGPQDNPDPELFRLPRVCLAPAVAYRDLPALAASASVLIMPYADLPVTRAMQPLKLKEYLATGKPVVVRKLPATESWVDCCDVCDSPESFADAVLERLKSGGPESQRAARARLEKESWTAKAAQFEAWIDGRLLTFSSCKASPSP